MNLRVIDGSFSISRLGPNEPIPPEVLENQFFSITKTDEELSIVCETNNSLKSMKTEDGWSLIKVEGPLDFSLTGILASLANPLAQAKISIFTISTFDTDYLLLKKDSLNQATQVLKESGFKFV